MLQDLQPLFEGKLSPHFFILYLSCWCFVTLPRYQSTNGQPVTSSDACSARTTAAPPTEKCHCSHQPPQNRCAAVCFPNPLGITIAAARIYPGSQSRNVGQSVAPVTGGGTSGSTRFGHSGHRDKGTGGTGHAIGTDDDAAHGPSCCQSFAGNWSMCLFWAFWGWKSADHHQS